MIKLIEEFGADENKSLLVALPPHLLDEIKVNNKGEVDTILLIKVLKQYYEQQSDEVTALDRINIYDAIFNSARAVADKPVRRNSN